MEYKELATLYHMDASPERQANAARQLEERLNGPSTFHLGFAIPEGELFLTVPRELSALNQRVLRRERKVSNLMAALPGIAQGQVLRSLVFDEVVMSNAVENIHSTRKQIEDALRSGARENVQSKRFREFAKLYLDLVYKNYSLPKTPEDIRAIYDKIMDGEKLEDPLDGKLFRKDGVRVVDGVREIHHGVAPEDAIVQALDAMIATAGSPEVPELYSALVSHFIFEYVHPFYDGNGRTGRYLLSMYLEAPLSKPTALSLSRVIAENRSQYYQAFESVENPLNHGEITFFVIAMHDLILKAQEQLIEKLGSNVDTFAVIDEFLGRLNDSGEYSGKELRVLYVLLLEKAFGTSGEAALDDIAEYVEVGPQQTRKYLKALQERGVATKTRGRDPIMFALTDTFLKDIDL